jgi:hypothetical protein
VSMLGAHLFMPWRFSCSCALVLGTREHLEGLVDGQQCITRGFVRILTDSKRTRCRPLFPHGPPMSICICVKCRDKNRSEDERRDTVGLGDPVFLFLTEISKQNFLRSICPNYELFSYLNFSC